MPIIAMRRRVETQQRKRHKRRSMKGSRKTWERALQPADRACGVYGVYGDKN
jgi:hypothetical protein